MTQEDFIKSFSEFLVANFKSELLESNVESICDTILTDELMLSNLVKNYGNISLALYQYWKIVFNLDILTYNGMSNKLCDSFLKQRANIIKEKNKKINYDLLYLNDNMACWSKYFDAKECHIINNVNVTAWNDLFRLTEVNCDKLIIENWISLHTGSSVLFEYCNIKELVFSDKIDLIKFRDLFHNSNTINIESITYEGKNYNKEQFLDLIKQIKSERKEIAKKINLYIIRGNRSTWYGGNKKFYYYIFARKSKKSGKYRFALLSDMGSQGYSIAYFKSKEDAEKVLTKSWLSGCHIESARLNYLDISRGVKEVETDYGINILIKKGSPADR